MQLDWLTFALEMVNFVVLAWVLSRVLYKPVRAAIERRQAEARAMVASAEQARAEAMELDARYRARLAEWERAHEQRRAALAAELAEERERRVRRLDEELRAEREAEAIERARHAEAERRRAEEEAIRLGAAFAARLFGALAGPELHARIVARFSDELPRFSEEALRGLRADGAVEVRSAYPLDDAARRRLGRALDAALRAHVELQVREAPELICGIEVRVGGAALQANLARELSFFADAAEAAHA